MPGYLYAGSGVRIKAAMEQLETVGRVPEREGLQQQQMRDINYQRMASGKTQKCYKRTGQRRRGAVKCHGPEDQQRGHDDERAERQSQNMRRLETEHISLRRDI